MQSPHYLALAPLQLQHVGEVLPEVTAENWGMLHQVSNLRTYRCNFADHRTAADLDNVTSDEIWVLTGLEHREP